MKIQYILSRLESNLVLYSMLAMVLFLSCLVSPLAFANGATYVSNCDATVYSSHDYEVMMVTNDIVKTNDGHCIVIQHDNVTVDCQGYRATGIGIDEGWYGVWVTDEDAVIQNCEFNNWTEGIRFSADSGTALNNKLFDNYNGIAAGFGLEDLWIEGNKADDNFQAGILIHTVNYSVIYKNTVHGSACSDDTQGGYGIGLNEADYNFVVDNQTNLNCENGIRLQNGSDYNYVIDNSSNRNMEGREDRFGAGIAVVSFSDYNIVEDNTANRNDLGIITNTTNNTFDGNRCHNNYIADSSPVTGVCK